MKFLIQAMVMFSDVLIVLAAIVLFYSVFKMGSVIFALIVTVLLLTTYRTWKDQGGFIAWTKKGRQAFFKNWDEINERKN
jgi:hypothetical protein